MSTKIRRPGDEGWAAAQMLDELDRAGRKGLPEGRLARAVTAKISPDGVGALLRDLERRGEAVELDGRWLLVEHSGGVVGRLELLERGDALLQEDGQRNPRYMVPRRSLGGAGEGDLVLAEPATRRSRTRRWDRLHKMAVVKVLSRGLERLVGTSEIDEDGRRWLIPFDPRLDLDIEIDDVDDLPEEDFVVVEVEERRRPGQPLGSRIVEVLGDIDTPGVDVTVVLRHYGITEPFPAALLEDADEFPDDPTPEDWEGRLDLRDTRTMTIDGETARDFDDAVSLEERADGSLRLGVHIADVAHYVREGEPLDLEAYRRGTSVYFPDRAVPMLPEHLSNGLCSLRPEVPRLTLSAFLDFDAQGRLVRKRFAESVIRSHRRLTYSEVRRLLEEPRPEDAREYGEILEDLGRMRRLMKQLYQKRLERGSIDFDLPAGDVILDTDGATVGIKPGERNVAHRIIEEFMIAANEAVAERLEEVESLAIHRVHEPPRRSRLQELRDILQPLGIRLPGDLDDLPSSALQEVVRQIEGRPEEAFITSLVLRTMERAVYLPESRGHYALGADFYAHFTSPIRRYPDLVVHRRLKRLLGSRDVPTDGEENGLEERLEQIAEVASQTERRAERAEREILQWKKVRFLADRVGERFAARITGVQPFGLFVELEELFVGGLVPVRSLKDDYYAYDADGHRLVGDRQGHVFRLGDALEVKLTGVSRRHRSLDLEPVGIREPRRRQKGPRGKSGRRSRRRARS